MEPLDRHITNALDDAQPSSASSGPAEILLVLDDEHLHDELCEAMRERGHHFTSVASIDDARSFIAKTRYDVVVLHWNLADGTGLELAPLIQKTSPSTKIMMMAQHMSCDGVIQAMRCGAVDCLCLPLNSEDFLRRLDQALLKARAERQRDERLMRLKKICRELNIARHEISRQVDHLCDDLSNAYREIADQMSDVALASEFRTLLKQELDVEDLLRTTLEYLLTKTGPTNAAVFLPESSNGKTPTNFGLGAYVNYDCPRETIAVLLDHLGRAVCPQLVHEKEIVSFVDAREFARWIGADGEQDASFLADSQVIAFSCFHKGQCLAVMVLFRNKSTPFAEKLAASIDTMREIIAEQLSNVIRVHHRARPSWPAEAQDGDFDYHDDDLGFGGYEGGMAA